MVVLMELKHTLCVRTLANVVMCRRCGIAIRVYDPRIVKLRSNMYNLLFTY